MILFNIPMLRNTTFMMLVITSTNILIMNQRIKKVLSHYVCNTNDCNLYVESDYFAVIREDKSYYVYNVKTGNIINSFTTKEKYLVVNLIAKNNFQVE